MDIWILLSTCPVKGMPISLTESETLYINFVEMLPIFWISINEVKCGYCKQSRREETVQCDGNNQMDKEACDFGSKALELWRDLWSL